MSKYLVQVLSGSYSPWKRKRSLHFLNLIYVSTWGQLTWQSPFGPVRNVKKQNVGIWAHSEGREGRKVKCWLKRGENQSSKAVWLTACQGVFCGGVKSSTIALLRPPYLFLFLPLSLSDPSHASSPIITLSSPPKCLTKLPQYLSHFSLHCSSSSTIPRTPSHFLSQSLSHFLHRNAFILSHLRLHTGWHSFNLVVL